MARKPSRTTRIKNLIRDIPTDRSNEAKQVAEEALLLEDKLNEMKPAFGSELIVEEYDNGGGQTGTRENPTHTAYQKLLRSYIQTIKELDGMREPDEPSSCFPDWLV